MGYDISDTEKLKLPDYPDLEVVVKLATTFKELETIKVIGEGGESGEMDEAIQKFGDSFLDSWNISFKGEAVEPNGENFARLPIRMKLAIAGEWMRLMNGPSGPLESESSNGPDSPEPSTTEQDEG